MGLAPSANLNPEGRYPNLFQAIPGSAPILWVAAQELFKINGNNRLAVAFKFKLV